MYICNYSAVDSQLFGPQVSGRLDYSDLVVTVQLKYFVKSVLFMRVFKLGSLYKCMGFSYSSFSTICTCPGPNELG